jgi:PAS domain S-box-containing protein
MAQADGPERRTADCGDREGAQAPGLGQALRARLGSMAASLLHLFGARGRRSEGGDLLKALFDASRDAVSVSKDGRNILVNPALLSMLGYDDPSELVGRSVVQMVAPSERERISDNVRRRSAGEPVPTEYETRGIRKDGSEFDMQVQVSTPTFGEERLTFAILRDITDRRRAEREAEAWRRRYEIVAAASGEVVYEYTTKDGAIAWSGSIETVLGYTLAEMGGGVSQWVDLIHPEDREQALRALEASEASGGSYLAEYRFRHKAGHYAHVLDQGVALLDGSGVTERVVGVVRDLSGTRRAADRERRVAERTRFLLDLHVRSARMTDKEILDHALEEAVRLTGSTLGYAHHVNEATGIVTLTTWSRRVLDFCAAKPNQHYPVEQAGIWADCLRRGRPVVHNDYPSMPGRRGQPEGHAEIRNHMSVPVFGGGDDRLILGVGNKPEGYDDDDVVELQVIANELDKIVRSRRSAEALRASEEIYRTLVTASPEAILVLDATGRICYASPKAVQMAGVSSESGLVGLLVFSWIAPEDVERAHANFGVVIAGRELLGVRYRLLRSDGTVFWAEVGGAPIQDAAGEISGMIVVARDVTAVIAAETEHERLQAQLIELQKMDAVGRLAGGIAHDFNNLLTAVLGHSDLALGEVEAGSAAEESLVGIQKVVEQARGLTQQILAFGRRQVLRMTQVDANSEVEESARLLRRLIPESIEIDVRLAPTLPPVHADASQFRQVLLNLAINGRDAMRAGGVLTIETSLQDLSEDEIRTIPEARVGAYVCLTVTDTGTGMDESTALRVFEPFFTTKEMGQGTGLGLATVYGIVRQHGGFVRVETAPGAGTAFTVYLPAGSWQAAAMPATAAVSAHKGNETILLVEDEALVRGPLVKQLRAAGYDVLEADGPVSALEVARRHPGGIRLLLTDVVMPGMDGAALHQRLLEDRPGLPALFMSGYSGDVLVREGGALRDGFNLIQKPFGVADLTRRIRDILDGVGVDA